MYSKTLMAPLSAAPERAVEVSAVSLSSRREFLKFSAAGALVIGLVLKSGRGFAEKQLAAGPRPGAGRLAEAQRFYPHRARQYGHRDRQASRQGPGRDDRPADHRGRGARRGLEPDALRIRARQCSALQQPRFWPDPGHRRLHLDAQQLEPAPAGRGRGPRHADRRRRRCLEGAGDRDHHREGRAQAQVRQVREFRRARDRGGRAARADRAAPQGPQGLPADRHGLPPHRPHRQDQRHGPIRARCAAGRTC